MLFQVNSFTGAHMTVDLKGFDVVTMMRRLSQKEHSDALSRLASRLSAVVEFGPGAGEDPFAKVKELITDLITDLTDRLQSEASSEANHKSYPDDELVNASEKKADLEHQVATDSSKLEAAVSTSVLVPACCHSCSGYSHIVTH